MRFNPLADDPLTMPSAPSVPSATTTPTKPRRARKTAPKPEATQPARPTVQASPIAAALSKVPDSTLVFMANGSPLAGLPADELRQRTLAHAATFNGPNDWRRVFASLLSSGAEPVAAVPITTEPTTVPIHASPMSLVHAWRNRLHGFTAPRFA